MKVTVTKQQQPEHLCKQLYEYAYFNSPEARVKDYAVEYLPKRYQKIIFKESMLLFREIDEQVPIHRFFKC